MTREAINKLNVKQQAYCETMSALIARFRERELKEEFERKSGKLRGYLEGLCHCEVITNTEVSVLYSWYFSKDRS